MFIDSLKIFNFRNLANTEFRPIRGLNLVVGRNAQGKTNLLEAVHLLSQARSFRSSDISEVVRWHEKQCSVFGMIRSSNGESAPFELGLAIDDGKKQAWLNGQRLELFNDFVSKFVTVTFSPLDLVIVKGGPLNRRKFFDRHLADYNPAAIDNFFTFQRALKNKAQILKDGSADVRQLEAWDLIICKSGLEIVAQRKKFVELAARSAATLLKELAEIDGELSLNLSSDFIDSGELLDLNGCLSVLRRNRTREMQQRTCLAGPQRDDVRITLNGSDSRAFASQGQTRSIVVALKLAVIELIEAGRSEAPVIILDDVESELDQERANHVLQMATRGSRQVFISGTDTKIFSQLTSSESLVIDVSNGVITT